MSKEEKKGEEEPLNSSTEPLISNLRINFKTIKKLAAFSLITLTTMLYVKSGNNKNSSSTPKGLEVYNNTNAIIETKEDSNSTSSKGEDVVYYGRWEKIGDNKYQRKVYNYDFSSLTEEEIAEFLRTKEINLLENHEDILTISYEEKENINEEELYVEPYFLVNYDGPKNDTYYVIVLFCFLLGGNVLIAGSHFIKNKIDYFNLEKELEQCMGYEYTKSSKSEEKHEKVIKKEISNSKNIHMRVYPGFKH